MMSSCRLIDEMPSSSASSSVFWPPLASWESMSAFLPSCAAIALRCAASASSPVASVPWIAAAAAFLAASMAAGLPPSMPMTFSSAALAESPLTTLRSACICIWSKAISA